MSRVVAFDVRGAGDGMGDKVLLKSTFSENNEVDNCKVYKNPKEHFFYGCCCKFYVCTSRVW